MRRILASLLVTVLSDIHIARADSPAAIKATVSSLTIGDGLKVKTKSGQVVRGKLSSVGQDGFTISVSGGTSLRRINFADADRVTKQRTHTPVAAWIAVAAIVAVVIVVIAAFAIEHHNEQG